MEKIFQSDNGRFLKITIPDEMGPFALPGNISEFDALKEMGAVNEFERRYQERRMKAFFGPVIIDPTKLAL